MSKNIIIILFISLSNLGCNTKQESIQYSTFKSKFTKDQAIVLDEILINYIDFLEVNYPNKATLGSKTKAFLSSIPEKNNWTFNTEENAKLFLKFEKCGLRKEFYMWGYERDYNPYQIELDELLKESTLEINQAKYSERIQLLNKRIQEHDSAFFINTDSRFVDLTKIALNDTMMNIYFDAYYEQDNMSPAILIGGLLDYEDSELSNPNIQLLIIREFYFMLVKADIEKNKRP